MHFVAMSKTTTEKRQANKRRQLVAKSEMTMYGHAFYL